MTLAFVRPLRGRAGCDIHVCLQTWHSYGMQRPRHDPVGVAQICPID